MSALAIHPRTPVPDALHQIQEPVRERLDSVAAAMVRIVSSGVPMIEEVAGYLLSRRGKMLRPTLTLLASELDGNSEPRAVDLAAVIELMHLATLVHDDSVDHSVTRRGRPTVNSVYSHQVSVIMGDFLYSRALRALVTIRDLEVLRIVTDVSSELSLGEMRQLAAVDALEFSEADYDLLIRAKTASLLSAACESGACCGAAQYQAPLARFGDRLGMAFQVVDDILDYTEDETVTGKPSGNDLREHKVTAPLIGALRSMSAKARARVDVLFDTAEPGDALIQEVMGIVIEEGGVEYARRRSEQFAREAEEALVPVPASSARDALLEVLAYVTDRRW